MSTATPVIPDLAITKEAARAEAKLEVANPLAAQLKKELESKIAKDQKPSTPPPTKVSEVDCLRAQRDAERLEKFRALEAFHMTGLQSAQEKKAAYEATVESGQKAINEKYRIGPSDRIDFDTGVITRKPQSVPAAPVVSPEQAG